MLYTILWQMLSRFQKWVQLGPNRSKKQEDVVILWLRLRFYVGHSEKDY